MEALDKLKNPHSRMLFLIQKMYKEQQISTDTKINLKYLVFMNDPNLFNIFNKGYTELDHMLKEIKEVGEGCDREVLEEELKNSNFLDSNATTTTEQHQNDDSDAKKQIDLISSPMGSFLANRKRQKQVMDKPIDNFYLDRPVENHTAKETSSAVMSCGIGESPKFQPVSRRNRQ